MMSTLMWVVKVSSRKECTVPGTVHSSCLTMFTAMCAACRSRPRRRSRRAAAVGRPTRRRGPARVGLSSAIWNVFVQPLSRSYHIISIYGYKNQYPECRSTVHTACCYLRYTRARHPAR